MNPKVEKVEPTNSHTLLVTFSNGEIREFDAKPYIDKGIFTELQDLSYFRLARVVAGSVEWPHEQDFSFDTLYIASCPISPNQNAHQLPLSPAVEARR